MLKWLAITLLAINFGLWLLGSQAPSEFEVEKKPPSAISLQEMMLLTESPLREAVAEPREKPSARSGAKAETLPAIASQDGDQSAPVSSGLSVSETRRPRLDRAQAPMSESTEAGKALNVSLDTAAARMVAPSDQKGGVTPESASEFGAPAAPEPASSAVPESASSPPVQCYKASRMETVQARRLKKALNANGVVFREVRTAIQSPSPAINGVRVYVGPFQSKAALQAQERLLSAKKIDRFQVRTPEGVLIQLGYFTEKGKAMVNATRFRDKLAKLGVEARLSGQTEPAKMQSSITFTVTEAVKNKVRDEAGLASLLLFTGDFCEKQ